jgi:hypoxanthine-DNA glycosylase
MTRLVGLPPVIGLDTRLLVLGSFPGAASLREQRYYGHPQNQFWKILSALWSVELTAMDYLDQLDEVRSRGLGIWDVYAACEREGSLDANIRATELNDFACVQRECPKLRAIAHNGGESFRHAKHMQALDLPVYKLPSTSPANASWSFDKKLHAWREVFKASGLLA